MFKKSLIFGLFCATAASLFLWLKPIFAGDVLLNPVAFSVGPFSVRWYGVLIGLAIAIGFYWSAKRLKKSFDEEVFDITIWWAIIGGIFGARFFYIIQNVNYFKTFPNDIFKISEGGLSIHGALLGGFLAAYLALSRDLKKLLSISDAVTPALLFGMILGRFGNFFNYEIFGYPTNVAWKMFVPAGVRPVYLREFDFFHPVFLYEAILNAILLIILLRKEKSYKLGELTLKFFAGISITRFIVEFFRIGDTLFAGLTLAQVVSLIIFILVTAFFARDKIT